jgi:hypothetical protein
MAAAGAAPAHLVRRPSARPQGSSPGRLDEKGRADTATWAATFFRERGRGGGAAGSHGGTLPTPTLPHPHPSRCGLRHPSTPRPAPPPPRPALQVPEADISPVAELPYLTALPKGQAAELPALLAATAVLKLNGGLGTSMGLEKAKSLLEVKDGNTFVDLIAQQVGGRLGKRAAPAWRRKTRRGRGGGGWAGGAESGGAEGGGGGRGGRGGQRAEGAAMQAMHWGCSGCAVTGAQPASGHCPASAPCRHTQPATRHTPHATRCPRRRSSTCARRLAATWRSS